MRIVIVSDTHGQHNRIDSMPAGDLFIHCGDYTDIASASELRKFNDWLGILPYKHKIMIAGNHDTVFEIVPQVRKIVTNAIYLQDESIEIEGLKIYGSPWQPWFCDWAFNLPRDGDELKERWAQIPDDTQILITHSPPLGILDTISPREEELGCQLLANRIKQLSKLKLHCFGHIHGGYGKLVIDKVTYVNASTCTEQYLPDNEPIVVDID